MKVNELMIGNWVKFPFGNEKIIDLPYIPGRGICASFAASATLFPVEVKKLQPVTLTPEILKKNFPTAGELAWWPVEDGLHCESHNTEDIMVSGVFRFVHQLQNALRLVGVDKTIVL